MRVAVLSPVWFPVPPAGYRGIEWIVALLADGLVDAGHEVTLYARRRTPRRDSIRLYRRRASGSATRYWELRHHGLVPRSAGDFDVISDHTGLLGLALGSMGPTPLAHTVHGPLSGEPGALYEQVVEIALPPALISVSDEQRRPKPHLPWVATCANALDLSVYRSPRTRRYLLFLGRMTADKGAHRAIAVAIERGLPLKLAASAGSLSSSSTSTSSCDRTSPKQDPVHRRSDARRKGSRYDNFFFFVASAWLSSCMLAGRSSSSNRSP